MGKKNIWLELRSSVLAIDDAWLRALLFGHFGRIWPEAGEKIYWADALTALESVRDENERCLLLARFTPYLPDASYERVACMIEKVVWKRNRIRLLLACSPFMPPKDKNKALVELLETLVSMPSGPETVDQLGHLVPFLSEIERIGAIGMIQEQPGLWNQAQKIRPFLPYLRIQDRQTVVSQIIFRCRRLEPAERFRVMAEVAQYLPEPKLRELVDGFRELDDDTSRIAVLERTAEVLPEAQMAWIWDGIQSIWNKNRRTWLICHLYNWLPANRQPLALAEIRNTLAMSAERDSLLLSIRDEVPHVLLFEVLPLAAEASESVRVEILSGLLSRMSGDILAEGLEIALGIGRSDLRSARLEMLDRMAERLVAWANDSPEDARKTWQMLFARRVGKNGASTGSASSRAELLVDLAGLLPFFLHFVPPNHKPNVAHGLVEELRRFVTGPRMMVERHKVGDMEQLIN
jgi:hypothetical protein